jgi:hypothetical protein
MSIKECVEKLVMAGQVDRKVADDALALYDRMNNRYSAQAGPASSEAAAAHAQAPQMRGTVNGSVVIADILLVDGVSILLQTDGASFVCIAGGC